MNLIQTAKNIRKKIIAAANKSKAPHVGSCLSCVDLLTALFFNKMKLDPWEERDIFILSKGHAALALYSSLCERGIITGEVLDNYYQDNGTLPGHLDRFSCKGVEVSAGSLGHGFNIGLGMAHGFKLQKSPRKVFAVIGDGESQEGSIWEGALFASKLGINNFTALIDYNNLQGYGRAREICEYEPLADKWKAFGWHVSETDGHDHESILRALNEDSGNKPKVVIARTVKGKGVSFMEDQLIWHYYIVTDEHKNKAFEELK